MASYINVAEADSILADMLPTDNAGLAAWNALSEGNKNAYLVRAMLSIDSLPYRGSRAAVGQQEAFPRAGQAEVPEAVKQAQALEACALVSASSDADVRQQMQAQGVKSFSLGSLSESYEHVGGPVLLSGMARALLRPYVTGVVPIV